MSIVTIGPYDLAKYLSPTEPVDGSVEEFLLLWAKRLPAHIKTAQVKRWTERDLVDGFTLTVRWPKDA